jgi:hypothetical protein
MGGSGDVEMRAARGGAPLVAASTPVDPDSLSTHLAPLRVMEECFLASRVSIVDGDVWTFGACVRSEEQWRWEDTRIGDAVDDASPNVYDGGEIDPSVSRNGQERRRC